ncbi:hypothetical protein C1Y11_08480 [Pseudomonas sp. FW305-20]|nr:hypothetical protein C1Y11_08480 [Pseudomonas sp. FW305-20]PMU16316.1 hypothetical protein C1Y10_19595 [Pseudomonas sp. FW305-122]PMU37160.1 hypothetical protein C1Y12_20075 [Pseudomonas sp. FW305-47B]PMX58029.1 hypothetical protein C1Y13_22205 [Pseudomonas sp. FW305-33]PMX66290.1 hypothetical protein C1X12_17560 [Pseudomonas sp. FW305-60]
MHFKFMRQEPWFDPNSEWLCYEGGLHAAVRHQARQRDVLSAFLTELIGIFGAVQTSIGASPSPVFRSGFRWSASRRSAPRAPSNAPGLRCVR